MDVSAHLYHLGLHILLVCFPSQAEVTQRLSNAKEAANKSVGLQSHEDLAKKLQVINAFEYFVCVLVQSGGT